jgi:hypothetical protein
MLFISPLLHHALPTATNRFSLSLFKRTAAASSFIHHLPMTHTRQTNGGALIIYDVQVNDDTSNGLYTQNDSPFNYLRRDSAELFVKETIPSLKLNLVSTHE